MSTVRYSESSDRSRFSSLPAAALRAVLREGYRGEHFRKDALAGLVVGVVALPLAMALAINVGAPPQHGLYTAILAGFVVALLGGSRTQVTGPTAAFIVILAPICSNHGLAGLFLAGLMGGIILILMGLLRLGRLIEFIPHPVTTGFTAGIAVVIAVLQLKDLFGLVPTSHPDHFFERIGAMWSARGTANPWDLAIGLGTLAVLVFLPRLTKRIPAPLVALPVAALATWILSRTVGGFHADTIASRFRTIVGGVPVAGIPQVPPLPILPWAATGAGGKPFHLSFDTIQALVPGAFAVAMLGAIESLLSAVVADGMARTKHDPDAELLALGMGNVITPFFGGIPATGAIARTATNIRSGGRSPVAAMVHALTVLAAVLVLAPLIGTLPMASMAALLLLVAWNMSEAKHFLHTVVAADREDVAVLFTCFGLTVAFDMVIAVSVGFVLAALLFMRRMARLTKGRLVGGSHPELPRALPEGVFVYDIDGPLFFGAAQKAVSVLGVVAGQAKAVILRMDEVPHMDVSGLVALESALGDLERAGCVPIITGVQREPRLLLRKGKVKEKFPKLLFRDDIEGAIRAAEEIAAKAVAKTDSKSRFRPDVPPQPAH